MWRRSRVRTRACVVVVVKARIAAPEGRAAGRLTPMSATCNATARRATASAAGSTAETEAADGKAFTERGREDRHQFRFIVAPEDGDRLSDLRGFTRDVMRQMEEDLGTRLDWIAVDHFSTGHPHSHVIVRGRDELGKDLIIAQDYITDGLRLRPRSERRWSWPGDRPGAAGQAQGRDLGRALHSHRSRHAGGGRTRIAGPAARSRPGSRRISIDRCASAACKPWSAMGWPRRPSQGCGLLSDRLEPSHARAR